MALPMDGFGQNVKRFHMSFSLPRCVKTNIEIFADQSEEIYLINTQDLKMVIILFSFIDHNADIILILMLYLNFFLS